MLRSYIVLLILSSFLISFKVSNALTIDDTGECVHAGYLPKHHILFGQQLPIYTRSMCYQACVNDSTCISFDWDFKNPGCFLFFNKFEENLASNADVDHYFFLRNQSECRDTSRNYTWLPESDVSWKGEMIIVNMTHLIDCVQLCLENEACSGVDWPLNNSVCILNIGRGEVVNSTNSTHYSRPFFVPPPVRAPRLHGSGLALDTEYIIIIAIGLGLILLTIIAVVILCNYSRNKSTNRDTNSFFFEKSSDVGTNISDTNTDSQEANEPKPDLNNATFRSMDYKMSTEAATGETIQENDHIY